MSTPGTGISSAGGIPAALVLGRAGGKGGSPDLAPPLGLFPRGRGVRASVGGRGDRGTRRCPPERRPRPRGAGLPSGEPRRPWLVHVWLLDAEAAAAAAARSSGGGRMLGQQQQQLYSSAALLSGERSRLLTCYVQDYLECVESLPHDMQRNVSVLRELDNKYQGRARGTREVPLYPCLLR